MNTAKPLTRTDWQIVAGLIALTTVPGLAGTVRLVSLARGATITPDNARFFDMPFPVVVHIIGATLFCVVGAFQFAPGFRRRWPRWHRYAGRVLAVCGLAAALSGLWMTEFYPLHDRQLQGHLLHGFRLVIGSAMFGSIVLSWAAILRRDIARHRAWLIRGYAIGQGAGTQVFVLMPWALLVGTPSEQTYDLLMISAWLINLAVAEWLIRRQPRRQQVERTQIPDLAGSITP